MKNVFLLQRHKKMTPLKRFLAMSIYILWVLLWVLVPKAEAASYNFSLGLYPPCTSWNGQWVLNGSTYECYGSSTLASGDTLSADTPITAIADSGWTLNNNTIGSSTNTIILSTSWNGPITTNGTSTLYGGINIVNGLAMTFNNLTINGSITSNAGITLTGVSTSGNITASGNLNFTNVTVSGNVSGASTTISGSSIAGNLTATGTLGLTNVALSGNVSSGGTSTLVGATIAGSFSSGAGDVSMNGGSVAGAVTVTNAALTATNGTVFGAAVTASNNVSLTGGSVAGALRSNNGSISIVNAVITGSSITANNAINISNSTVGSSNNSVSISTTNNHITLADSSVVYGALTATIYSYGIVYVNSGSSVIGTCAPNTSPANACSASPPAGVDHYELQLASNHVACMGASVVVRACADSASPCTLATSVSPTVTLNTSAGSLQATSVNLAAGTATTTLSNPFAANGSATVVTLSGETIAATNARKCCTGSASCALANSCSTTFNTAGFVFSNSVLGASVDIPHQVAGQLGSVGTGTMAYLRALQTNTTTGACTARFTAPQTIKLAYKCVNPSTCIAGETLTLNGTAVQANANAASPVAYSDVNLSFDANGAAPIPINYSDVGQVQLFASVFLPAANGHPDYTLTGVSNTFVVKPYDLKITSVQTASNGSNPQTTSSGVGFTAAGAAFKASVSAYAYTASEPAHLTPNFGLEASPETVSLQISALVNPSGGNTGLLANASAFTKVGTSFNNTTLSWNEVGTIALKAAIGDGNYLGAGNVIGLQAVNVGRFYPDHFKVVSKAASQTCTNFSYMGQAGLTLNYKLQAENAAGVVVTNYSPNYSSTLATPVYSVENADAGVNLNTLNGGVDRFILTPNTPAPSWTSGVLDVLPSSASFARLIANAKVVPDGPFDDAVIGLKLTDTLDARSIQTADLNTNPATLGACSATSSCTDTVLASGVKLRFGRLRLDDAFGPESHPLKVNFATEYWVGNHFSLNTSDSCTQVPRADITYKPKGNLLTPDNFTVNLTGGTTQGTYTTLMPTYIGFTVGSAGQMFTTPTNGAQGKFAVSVDMTNLPWLRFDWDQNGDYADLALPDANFTFGSYRGHDRIIYWREKLQ